MTPPPPASCSKLIAPLGKLPVNTQLAAYSNVVKPRQGGADWQLRFQVQFLFPK